MSIALLFLALLPQLRRMQEETERINRDLQRRDAALLHPVTAASALDAARAAVAKSPDDVQANLTLTGDSPIMLG